MKSVVALLMGLAAAWDKEYTLDEIHKMDTLATFKAWAKAFEREYASLEEESAKYLTWLDNLYVIADTNSQQLSYKLRLNQFGDMNKEEFRQYVHGKDGACYKSTEQITDLCAIDDEEQNEPVNAPASVDWTTKGVVTPVKNQGQCGMCLYVNHIK